MTETEANDAIERARASADAEAHEAAPSGSPIDPSWQAAGPPLEPSTERLLSAFAHVLALVSWSIVSLIVVAALYLVGRQRSPYLRFQAAQAFVYHVAAIAAFAVTGSILALLHIFALCFLPALFVLVLVVLLYPLWAAWNCLNGRPFEYPTIGPIVRDLLATGSF